MALPIPLALAAALASAPAQTAAPAVPSTAPEIAPIVAELDAIVADGWAAGLLAVVEKEGEVVLREWRGERDRDAGLPMERGTIFRIYSMTKPITCAVALTFFDEGRFDLDDPVSKYLPEFADAQVRVRRRDPETGKAVTVLEAADPPMRVRDLFSHTSGFNYAMPWLEDPEYHASEGPDDLAKMTGVLARQPLLFHPGSKFEYGWSTDVLGRLVEVLAEAPLDAVFAERMFEPLGMADTGFWVGPEKVERVATLYKRSGTSLAPAGSVDLADDPSVRPVFLSGGGGLFSTADDYLRFLHMMRNGGELDGERILEPETVALMTRDHIGDIPRDLMVGDRGFGLGVAVTHEDDARMNPGTWSWGGAAGTLFWVDPTDDTIFLFLVQNWLDFGPAYRFQDVAIRLFTSR